MSPRSQAAATSGGRRFEDLDGRRIHAGVLQGDERMEMRGRDERQADFLALELRDRFHPRPVARDERLGIVDVVENPEQRDIDALRQSCRDRARAGFAELDRSRCERADHVGAAAELAVGHLVARRLFNFAARLRVAPGHHHVLIADHDFTGFGMGDRRGKRDQYERNELEAQRMKRGLHLESYGSGVGTIREQL